MVRYSYPSNYFLCLQDIFKTSSRHVFKRYLQDVFKTSWKTKNCYAEDVLKTSSTRLEDQQMSSRRLEDQQRLATWLPSFTSNFFFFFFDLTFVNFFLFRDNS